ncbi:MAG: MFS transporter [Planctomycetota bacterium]|nr:MFS transporter [Planctomycetota bacterium]
MNISDTAMGWVFGAFTVAYGLFEIVTGAWGDRYGSRRVLTRIVIWWSAFTVLTGCVPAFSWPIESWLGLEGFWPSRGWVVAFNSLAVLLVVRFLFGAGEAGALPNTARVVSRWFPLAERGLAQGTVLTCMLAGATASPPLAAWIIKHFGWRWTFVAFGGVGVLWAGAFFAWFRDDPAEHSGVNHAELDWITSGRPAKSSEGGHPPIPWSFVLSGANVWLLGSIISCAAFTAYFYTFFFPTYLQNGRGMGEEDSGWYAGMVNAGGACGAFLGSMLAGWIDRSGFTSRWKRNLVGCGLLGSAAIALSFSVACDTPLGASLCVMLAYCLAQAQQATWWAVVADISGKHLGAMFGLMNSMGVPGAFYSTVFTGRFVDQNKARGLLGRDAWDPIFIYFVGVLAIGALLWLFVDVTRSAVEPDEQTAEGLLAGKLVPEPAPAA